ncbi:hypothetical protein LIA77_07691 [Sarocladium implicatum]|nr:hypothetical protein LIA77_07691 [Sarocladium implicatum]
MACIRLDFICGPRAEYFTSHLKSGLTWPFTTHKKQQEPALPTSSSHSATGLRPAATGYMKCPAMDAMSDGLPPYEDPRDADREHTPERNLDWLKPKDQHNVAIRFQVGELGTSTGWLAALFVKAADVPGLMKSGLGRLEECMDKEAGHVVWPKPGGPVAAFPWSVARRYKFHKAATEDSPAWSAELCVFASQLSQLSSFRVADLNFDTCTYAGAWLDDRAVYYYSRSRPWHSFNAIYDDMPLGDLWPWPVPKPKEQVGGDEIFEE